ncbi:hypothetical protein [Mycobacterium asiaticum]|uniref:hypothetical protein n=1 Tax=Mycobacterium asiaticum TaxID=1790 RepID=UPI0012DB0D7A|nr:hypothetical protein [Mycobacterium asiaticum]
MIDGSSIGAKQTQQDAADALYRAIIETLDRHRNKRTLDEHVLDALGRADASISSNVPQQGRLG